MAKSATKTKSKSAALKVGANGIIKTPEPEKFDKETELTAYRDMLLIRRFEERAGQLAIGQPGTIRLRSQPSAEFHGSIARIGIESDRVNEERRVWLTCSDCPAEMFLGEQAEVRITTGNRDSALMVPEVAITGFDGHRGMVWTVQDGRLARVGLTFGARDDRGRVEVTGGLPEGATIVAGPPKGAAEGRRARTSEAP